MPKYLTKLAVFLTILFTAAASFAEGDSVTPAGDYLIHHTVFNSSFLTPEIAAIYKLTRGDDKAIINIAVTDAQAGASSHGLTAQVSGEARNLMQQQTALDFMEINEQDATYYIAPFEFDDQEILHFYIDVVLPGQTRSTQIKFSKKLYQD